MKGARFFRSMLKVLKRSGQGWLEDKLPRMGAAVAYYTVFSMAPLVVLVIALAGWIWGAEAVQNEIFTQFHRMVGSEAADLLRDMILRAREPERGTLAMVGAGAMLLLGATGVFVQIQDALNSIWHVTPSKSSKGWWRFIRKRFLSFAMILGIGFLLLVSLVVSAGLSALGTWMGQVVPWADWLLEGLFFVVAWGLMIFLFGLMFKYLPDVRLRWRDVLPGAILTSLLFTAGKFLLGLYLGKSQVVSGFGAAAGLVIILLWVYWSAQIFFLGAEVIRAWTQEFGKEVAPEPHAEFDSEWGGAHA